MDKHQVIYRLREHEPELKAAGINHLHIFGSTARGEARETSDVDLMANFDEAKQLSLFGLRHIRNRLCDILETNVDLSSSSWMYDHVRTQPQWFE